MDGGWSVSFAAKRRTLHPGRLKTKRKRAVVATMKMKTPLTTGNEPITVATFEYVPQ